ncbi:MAG: Acryloyl-CoA reductase electron transfer subunit gamma [Elusimicrobia bacterium ADurb.Bin231]|nr:MAG: Acryloyl-CoA reductase electron transfer subunit gamma [Elusimicrobia bacterium ADurb.Bin231]
MNIIVLIKQVPATTNVKIDDKTGTLKREGVEAQVNPFDLYAVEEAIRLKEKFTGKITVLTMGPPQADRALRETLAMGCDDAVLVSDRAFAGSDTWATSYTLAQSIKKLGNYDVILCGKQAIDGDTAQVGPGVAEMLNIPHVAYVKKIEKIENNSAVVERFMEDGYDVVETPLPCLFTVVKEINTPRLPSLRGMMFSKKAEIKHLNAEQIEADATKIGVCGSPTTVMKVFTPPQRQGGERIAGEPQEQACKLVGKLKEIKII